MTLASSGPATLDPRFLAEVDGSTLPVSCRPNDYPAGHVIQPHAHAKDVALALGYDSPSAFATMFKRQFGQTPSAFFR